MAKREGKAGYLNIYMPGHIADQFKAHCNKNGLIISATVTILIKEYLERQGCRG